MEKDILNYINNLKDEAIDTLIKLLKIPAISPDFGGEGEIDKAQALVEILEQKFNFDKIEKFYAKDLRAKEKIRPNIIATYKGDEEKSLWIITHLDVVPPGDLKSWTVSNPFEPKIFENKLYARGSEDNGQSLISSLYAVKAIMDKNIKTKRTIKLAFVSDEEAGSNYGLKYLLNNHNDLFNKEDFYLIPDAGNSDGTFIEIAEKSILQFKVIVKGKQVHASTPDLGLNSHRVSLYLAMQIDEMLHNTFKNENSLFDPPYSTFEPTMVSNGSSSPNIIPGVHETVFDCRVIPEYKLDDILDCVNKSIINMKGKYKKVFNKSELPDISLEIIDKMESPKPTNPNSNLVIEIKKIIKELRNKDAKIGGIGGITFASFLRAYGYESVVWSTIDDVAHQPNEYAIIDNLINDSKVFAMLMLRLM
ncbi:MAG: M20 family metallo-hydrolase [Caldisphaera sp.]|nr:MAG: diaminopimelate aminotransferase [Caldisphaera sp.]PMP88820.1 MAG: diaminopimelate aminotransferase [Caldisphaera sp.]